MIFIGANARSPQKRVVVFEYRATAPATSVSVVGQFNNWDRSQDQLRFDKSSQLWKGRFFISVGVYQYLFVVNNSNWIRDPNAKTKADQNGNINSLLVVYPPEYGKKSGIVGDGQITVSALLHRPDPIDTCRLGKSSAYVLLRTRSRDVEQVQAVTLPNPKIFAGKLVTEDPIYAYWRVPIRIRSGHLTQYYFHIIDGKASINYGENGVTRSGKVLPFSQAIGSYPLPCEPSWAKSSVFYQIFPDRFYDGDYSIDPPDVSPWGTIPTPKNWQIRTGGDLQGIIDKLGYLKSLGINALYINPIFKSMSNHGYDTIDYLHVDPRFGSNQLLKKLVALAHADGIKVVLDGVFNHCSPQFFAFQDVIKNGRLSKYKNWFFVKKFPVSVEEGQDTYETFAGVPTMVKLNQGNPETQSYFLHVARYWLKYAGIDGWRLDDANEVSDSFWKAFRKTVKSVNPNALLMGEEWGDAHQWLQGDMHDSVMNYRWRDAVLNYFVKQSSTTKQFAASLQEIRADYPNACFLNEYNLLGSHDTERIRTLCRGDFHREAACLVFQFLYGGVPTVYYGDEIGLEGGHDPDDRRCMDWNKSNWDLKVFKLYKALIQLRKSEPVLQSGTCRLVSLKNGIKLVRELGATTIWATFEGSTVRVYKLRAGRTAKLILRV